MVFYIDVMPSSNRCVFGCVTTGVTIHKFPNPGKHPEFFRIWVELAKESLRGLTDEKIYKNKNVCDRHFTENVKNRNNRLNNLAVPTLHLSGTMTVDSVMDEIHQQPGPSNILNTSQLGGTMTVDTVMDEIHQRSGPSNILNTSQLGDSVLTVINNDHTYFMKPELSSRSITYQTKNTSHFQKSACYTATQRELKNLRSEVCRLRRRSNNFKTRLACARKLSNNKALERITNKMSLPAKLFTSIQFRESKKKPKGHRFTNEEKILALSLYKRSPKCYSLLSKCFKLPSNKTLKNLLGRIKVYPGLNEIIFEKLKHAVTDMAEDDRLCTLIFDEMSINPQMFYNAAEDELKGFTTVGKRTIADHVLTFMVRGVKRNFKQPIAYFFTSCLNKVELKNCIKEVVRHVQSTGLIIIATVCDQSTVNVSAIDSIVADTKALFLKKGLEFRHDVMVIGAKRIIPIYDTPHLIKGIRNNLLTKNLSYIDIEDGKQKVIKWKYFQMLYHADMSYGEFKILQKLTEDHVNPQRINKMRVKTATQIFSRSVAVAAKHLVDSGKLPLECYEIVPFVTTIDKVFDSLNCNMFYPLDGKIYRAGVKMNSPHHKLWQECITFFQNMKFIEKMPETGRKIQNTSRVVPSVKNFIKTLMGMQVLWKLLHGRYGLDTMLCRNFNQDPIENFFGNIRSLGVRNVAPNAVHFEAAFKSLLLNNFCSTHSVKRNCEDDMTTYLQSVDFFLHSKVESKCDGVVEDLIINEELLCCRKREVNDPESYICGWILKKCCTKIIKGCKVCKESLVSENVFANAWIKAKEFDKNKSSLCYPSEDLKLCFNEIQNISLNLLKQEINPKKIKSNIKLFCEFLVSFEIFKCPLHKTDLKKYFEEVSINIILYSWCRSVNRILCGKMKYDGDDSTKTNAQIYYNKHKYNKNRK